MANPGEENLIPANKRTEDELREMTSNGGKKSGEVRRRNKSIRKALQAALKGDYEVGDKTLNGYDAMAYKMIVEAIGGNVQAFKEVRDSIGEKPKDEVQLDGNITVNFNIPRPDRSRGNAD